MERVTKIQNCRRVIFGRHFPQCFSNTGLVGTSKCSEIAHYDEIDIGTLKLHGLGADT